MVCEVWRVARSTVYTMRARGLGSEVGEPESAARSPLHSGVCDTSDRSLSGFVT